MDCSVCRQIESPCIDTYCMFIFLVSGVVRSQYPHTRDQTEKTALILASWNGDAECVRLLLDAGADKNAKDRVRGQSTASAVWRLFDGVSAEWWQCLFEECSWLVW